MVVVKVFSPSGKKTVEMLGNVEEQDYDPLPVLEDEVVDEFPL